MDMVVPAHSLVAPPWSIWSANGHMQPIKGAFSCAQLYVSFLGSVHDLISSHDNVITMYRPV